MEVWQFVIAPILTGLISSVVGALIMLFGLRLLRPKIDIANVISVYPSDDKDQDRYRIKIRNTRTRREATDVEVQVFLEHEVAVDGGTVSMRRALGTKYTMHTIPRRNKKDEKAPHAHRIRLDRELLENEFCEAEGRPRTVVVSVYCKDALSGIGKTFEQRFPLGLDRFEHGSFRHGDDMTIQPYNGQHPFRLKKKLEEIAERKKKEAGQRPAKPAQVTQRPQQRVRQPIIDGAGIRISRGPNGQAIVENGHALESKARATDAQAARLRRWEGTSNPE